MSNKIKICKCGASYLDDQHPICPECMIVETTVPPQEVEAKWTYTIDENKFTIHNGATFPFIEVGSVEDAKFICDRFNELDRLRSYHGKVPDVTQELAKEKVSYSRQVAVFGEREATAHWQLWMMGAQWMRSEVSPYILKLEEEKEMYRRSVGRTGDDYLLEINRKDNHIAVLKEENESLRSELKAAKEALSEARDCFDEDTDIHKKITALLAPKKDNNGR